MRNMEIKNTLNEFLSDLGLKGILVIAAALCVSVGMILSILYFTGQPSTVKMENSVFYDKSTNSIVLSNNTASLAGLNECDIFVSGPSKQIKYLSTVDCSSLSSTAIDRQDLLDLFNGQKGTYTVIINSQEQPTGKILQFSISD